MDTQKVIEYLDELVSSHTKKHLNDVHISILEGVLNGQNIMILAKIFIVVKAILRMKVINFGNFFQRF